MRIRLGTAIVGLIVLLSNPALAQTTWVVDQGGAGDFTTIQACIDDPRVADGDTCLVNPGTYDENLSVAGKSITLTSAEGPEMTAIDGGGTGPVVTLEGGGTGPLTLEGFTIRGGYAEGAFGDGRGAGVHVGCVSLVIRNCTLTENSGNGYAHTVYLACNAYYETRYVSIENCRIIDNSVGGIHQRSESSASLDVTDSEVSGNLGEGIKLTWGSVENCLVENNVLTTPFYDAGIYAEGDYGDIWITGCRVSGHDGVGIYAYASYANVTITNTVITGNSIGLSGYTYYNTNGRIRLYHCTLSGNTTGIAPGPDCCPGVRIFNSIVWDEVSAPDLSIDEAFYSDIKGGFDGPGNININPAFAGQGDFHLKPWSLCIDRASAAYGTDVDIEGNPRPQGKGYDMGAYEFVPGSAWTVQDAESATLCADREELEQASRVGILLAFFLVPGLAILLMKRFLKARSTSDSRSR